MIFKKFRFIYIFIFGIILGSNAGKDHKKLVADLFASYDVSERPVHNELDTVNVGFGITILNLIEVNVVHGYLETNLWLSMEWYDAFLKWNSSDYGGIGTLIMYPYRIWKPDILLYNSIQPNFDPTYPTNALIKEDGTVTFIPPGIFRTSCLTDVTDYPYDQHNCTLKFGSWTHHGSKINLTIRSEDNSGDLSSFLFHSEWQLLAVPGKVNTLFYACCPEPYVDVTFVLQIKRRGDAVFSGSSFALFLGAASTILGFFLPTNSGHRLNMGIISLIGILILSNSIHNYLGGQYSSLVSYFRTLCFMIFTSIISNVFIIYFFNRNTTLHKIPDLMRTIFCEHIPHFILLNRPKNTSTRVGSISSHGRGDAELHDRYYDDLVSDLQVLVQRMSGQETQAINDWQYFAIVLDRLALIIYTISTLIFFFALYCRF